MRRARDPKNSFVDSMQDALQAEQSSGSVHDMSMLHRQIEWDCSSEPQLEAVWMSSHRHGEQVDSLDAHGESSCMVAEMADWRPMMHWLCSHFFMLRDAHFQLKGAFCLGNNEGGLPWKRELFLFWKSRLQVNKVFRCKLTKRQNMVVGAGKSFVSVVLVFW
ncbi:hypothetical protein L7F22_062213 [Adiantum nelumboides]|nr:hypothetical protein [Adiantum nelumboides]